MSVHAHVSWQLALAQSAAGTARSVVERAVESLGFARADAQRAGAVAGRLVGIVTEQGPAPADRAPGGLLAMTQQVCDTVNLFVFHIDGAALIAVTVDHVSADQWGALHAAGARVEMEQGGCVVSMVVTPTPPSGGEGSAADPAHAIGSAGPVHAAGAADPVHAIGAGGAVDPAAGSAHGEVLRWFGWAAGA